MKEFRSSIYSIKKGNDVFYSYTPSSDNNGTGSAPVEIPEGTKLEGDVHTHTNATKNTPNPPEDEFIGRDVTLATDEKNNPSKVPYYLATPNGSLKKYDPKKAPKDALSVISSDLPSDHDDQTRKNDISSFSGVSDKKMIEKLMKKPVAKRDNIPNN